MSNRHVIFKCSFGSSDGWGHVIRSSAVASAFQQAGWRTALWTESDMTLLPAEIRESFDDSLVDFFADDLAEYTSVLFVDEMYTSDEDFDKLAIQWRHFGGSRLLVGVDDMQQRSMAAFDIVINTEIGLKNANYAAKTSLLGERYAMLRSGFSNPIALSNKFLDTELVPVFVMLGGTDAYHYTPRVLEELYRWNHSVAPVAVYSPQGDRRNEVLESLRMFKDYRLLENVESAELAAWMQACRFGVIACGTSLYEAAAMQMPFVGLSLVDNQKATAEKVESNWGLPVVQREGQHDEVFGIGRELERVSAIQRRSYSEVELNECRSILDTILWLLR